MSSNYPAGMCDNDIPGWNDDRFVECEECRGDGTVTLWDDDDNETGEAECEDCEGIGVIDTEA